MAKIINITDKLRFDENPKIVIKDIEFEVNADAETMLKIMGELSDNDQLEGVLKAFNLLFSEEDRKKMMQLKMPAKSLMTVVSLAMDLVMGEEEKK